ncbi:MULTISPECIES: glycosyltransferase family 2 protein [unclassified Lentimicrobium]|uniref:glycosyltransferase family 2 protein n=1 Tax=unclassified Lentimicrobium TaxID=2677434 RepID=UPI0015572AF9|nr:MULTISPECIES: glycosyltransferase family 2 protein [unclassified Lentimicrobium]NPD47237.1 glycosyltransferase family 2 protein [Lentimicrobium sp. S6]NPD83754.1 glycosyltransferase family 2 protein [Lentimicrobium sp. L6]
MMQNKENIELSILMPCLNEAETLAICIRKAMGFLAKNRIVGEVVIADNGSTDQSVSIAKQEGARVIHVNQKGYGNALISGILDANGKYIIMGDADDSYDFSSLDDFVKYLREGYDLVMGNRFKGGVKKGAMPPLHKYLGNPVLSFVGRLFFRSPIKDFHCGLRGFNKEKILSLSLVSQGMEFASEMVVKASIMKLKIKEVPIILYPDGRTRKPHLRTWRDGWRHLVFLLMYSPKWLFFFPSLILFGLSLSAIFILLPGTLYLKDLGLDIHTLTVAGTSTVLSFQLFLFAIFIRVFSINQGLYPAKNKHIRFANYFSLEKGIIFGIIFFLLGLGMLMHLFYGWMMSDFGHITDVSSSFRILIPSLTFISLGIQSIFASFFLRILDIKPIEKVFVE